MKIFININSIKLFSLFFIIFSLIPIIEIEIFYILIFSITIIIFSKKKIKISYLKLFIIISLIFSIKFIYGKLYINEGNNILIFNDKSKNFYQNYLPENMFNFIEEQFDFYSKNSNCNQNDPKCWKSFDPLVKSIKGTPLFLEYSPSMDLQKSKFSRKLKNLNIYNLKSAKISEVNNLRYNYFWGEKFDLVRENIPFFVMIEIPKYLKGSNICWKGNLFWENDKSYFQHLKNNSFKCKTIDENHINKKIYAVSLGKSETNERLNYLYGEDYISENDSLDIFLKKNELIFKIEKKMNLILFDYGIFILLFILIILFINNIYEYNQKLYIYTLTSTIFFIFLAFYSDKDLFFGFNISIGGNDGLVYNSYANNIFHYLKLFNVGKFLLGAEEIYYFPSLIRYFLAIFKVLFNDTNYGYLAIGYILCIIVYSLFIKIYDFKFGLFFAFLVICTRLLEGYGASIIKLLKHVSMNDAEPFAITIFFIALYIFIYIYENNNKNNYLLNFIFGVLLFITITLRPNYLPTVFLLALIHIYFLYFAYKFKDILFSLLGLSLISCIPLHNLYFGKEFILLTSGHVHATSVPLGVYFNAFIDLINLNFSNSQNINKVIFQFNRWIKPEEFHYLLIFFLLFLVFKYQDIYFKIISSLALSQHAVLLIFMPSGRYSYLAWFLSVMIFLYFIQKATKFIISKSIVMRKYL